MSKKQQIVLLVLIAVLILGGVVYGSYYFWQKSNTNINQKACTMEAKLCPDGSAVGRTGANCEFAACPTNSNQQPANNTVKIEEKTKAYYNEYRKQCKNSACCLSSVNDAEKNNSLVFSVTEVKCPDGFSSNGLECVDSFAWCEKNTQIANPASTYCVANGGKSEIRTAEDGSQAGYCKFSDGSECEEWAFFRKECGKGNPD